MASFQITEEILCIAAKALAHPLCDHCLGRLFGKHGHGLSNRERGRLIRASLTKEAPPLSCWLCEGFFQRVGEFANLALAKILSIEFESFLVGTRIPKDMLLREETFWKEVGTEFGESMRTEMNREIGKLIEKSTGKQADHSKPDVTILIDIWNGDVTLSLTPVLIAGRYRKLIRGIPQTPWPCRDCRGEGCKRCGGTGKLYQESVAELIGTPTARQLDADGFILHGAGREDADVRMLGNGRPFVLEIKHPRKRRFPIAAGSQDLKPLEALINTECAGKVEVRDIRYAEKAEIEQIKSAASQKVYRVVVEFQPYETSGMIASGLCAADFKPPTEKELHALARSLSGVYLCQATPRRVSSSRADLVRNKKIVELKLENVEGNQATFIIVAEAGIYIKEFVSGDGGRTTPSIAGKLNTRARVVELDVIDILDTRA